MSTKRSHILNKPHFCFKERQQKREQELIELKKTLSALTQSFQNTQAEVKQVTAQKEQVSCSILLVY